MSDLSLNIRLRGVDGGAFGLVRRFRSNLRAMETEDAGRHKKVMGRINSVVGGYKRIGQAMMSALTAGAGAAGVFIGAGLVGITRTAAQFEKYEAVLTGLEGSQAKAKASMAWVTQFAATTPYEIDQVMEAFVRLRAYGIDPTDGTLRALGDTASTMGKDVMSAVEMLADAQSGEFERLKEFGIRARQQGDQVTFSWVENGKTIERSSKKTGAEITRTLLGIFGPKNAGAMDRQSKTLGGIWSGLMDQITLFKVMVADAGLADFMRAELRGLAAAMQTPEGQARAKALASEISGALIDGIREMRAALAGVDWKAFIGGLVSIVTFIPKVISFFGGLQGTMTAIGALGIGKIGLDIGILATTIGGIAGVAIAPIAVVVAAITAVAIGAFLIWRNWKPISAWFKNLWALTRAVFKAAVWGLGQLFLNFTPAGLIIKHWSKIAAWFRDMWGKVKDAFHVGLDMVWSILPPWFRQILRGAAFVLRINGNGPGPTPPPGGGGGRQPPPAGGAAAWSPAQVPLPPRQRVGGQIDVRVFQDGRAPEVSTRSYSPDFGLASTGGVITRGG